MYKIALEKDFNQFWTIFFLVIQGLQTLMLHIPPSYTHHMTLFNSHMIIRILISLMRLREKFCFYIFYYFFNWPLETWFTHPMWTYNLCMWIKFAPLYKNVTLTIQDKCTYKRCTRFPFVEDFNRFWRTFSFFVIQWLHTHMPHITS